MADLTFLFVWSVSLSVAAVAMFIWYVKSEKAKEILPKVGVAVFAPFHLGSAIVSWQKLWSFRRDSFYFCLAGFAVWGVISSLCFVDVFYGHCPVDILHKWLPIEILYAAGGLVFLGLISEASDCLLETHE